MSTAQATKRTILMIAPQYPPAINGLGDYAARLGEGLAEAGYPVHYAGLEQTDVVTVQPYTALQPNGTHLLQIVRKQSIDIIVLNYSGYGYQRKGIPVWLVQAMQLVEAAGCRVIVFFHELYASGPPWTSAFWLHGQQKKIFRQLYQLAAVSFCSNRVVAGLIQKATPDAGEKNSCIGLFSNIPESDQLSVWENKQPQLVVFGSPEIRSNTYSVLRENQSHLMQLGAEAILDIGVALDASVYEGLSIPVKILGILPAEKVSQYMSAARFGALFYPDALLGKSGIMAAYAAHGLCVLNGGKLQHENPDGLIAGQHYINLTQPMSASVAADKMAAQALTWYQLHDFQRHLQVYLETIKTSY